MTPSFSSTLRSAFPGVVLALALSLPFLGKAFTIDDTLFMRQAEQARLSPRTPTAFEMVWSEFPYPLRMSSIMPSGPLMAWLLVPAAAAGGSEPIAHGIVALLFAAAVAATVRLAQRLETGDRAAAWCGLLTAAAPAAVGMATTAMPDVPGMALGVIGIEQSLAWRERGGIRRAVVASLALAGAALARPHLLLLPAVALGLMARTAASRRDVPRTLAAGVVPALVGPAVFAVVLWATQDPLGGAAATAGAARTFSSLRNLGSNLVAYLVHLSAAIPLALPWLALHPLRVLRRPALWIVAPLSAVVVALGTEHARHAFWVGPLAGLGAAVLHDVLASALEERDPLRGVLGAWMLLVVPVTVYLHFPSKYLLAAAPAAAILVVSAASRAGRRGTVVLAATTLLAAALGVGIARADASFAEMGRRAVREWVVPAVANGKPVWFSGHWGFQWYAERAGARPLTATPPFPSKGDLAVSSLLAFGHRIRTLPGWRHVSMITDTTPGGRIFCLDRCAGFYTNGWGYLPWAWSDEPIDVYDLWEFDPSLPPPSPPS